MFFKAGGGVVSRLVRRMNRFGEVEIIHSARAGRQERKVGREKEISGPAGFHAISAVSLKYWRRELHKNERHAINLHLKDLIGDGGHQEEFSLSDLRPVTVQVVDDHQAQQKMDRRVRRCKAVVVGSNGMPNFIY